MPGLTNVGKSTLFNAGDIAAIVISEKLCLVDFVDQHFKSYLRPLNTLFQGVVFDAAATNFFCGVFDFIFFQFLTYRIVEINPQHG